MFRVTIEASDGGSGSTLSETRELAHGDSLIFGRDPGPGGVTLPGQGVSRRHFELVADAQGLTVTDLGSTNGTQLAGVGLGSARITTGQRISAADTSVTVRYEEVEAQTAPVGPQSRYITPATPENNGLPPDIPARGTVDVSEVHTGGRPVSEIAYCAIGAGIGSFVWIDHLRCYGVHEDDIVAIGPEDIPYATYARYCANSQIPDHERLRSNSASTPDNIWGFPGYALRESVTTGNPRYAFQVFGEPTLAESYTPRAGRVFRSFDREMKRINWSRMFRKGLVQALRKTSDGRYAIYWRASRDVVPEEQRNQVTLAKIVHVSTGYPATRFVDDFQDFLGRHPEMRSLVANAYEPHEHIYQKIESSTEPVNIMVRGRGIVASRILQRLSEARARNPNIVILHSIRSPIRGQQGAKYGWARRPVRGHVELQPFNWPKASWGGDVRLKYENADAEERGRILSQLGGTTTAERSDWIAIGERGGEEGWYRAIFGSVKHIAVRGEKLGIDIKTPDGFDQSFEADYLVDCTGLVADLSRSLFLADLLNTYELPQNHAWRERDGTWQPGPRTGLEVSNAFEIEGLRNGSGRVYAAGQVTAGGPYLAVDSFLGLQYAALRSVDDIGANRLTAMRPIGPARSAIQWLRWCAGSTP
ncbi:FHA domain-containing protein [Allosediminivita pacifica]|uniref:FHA domain-containing protein n=1 Tax=Allosediminivita pacifica TaxID=1267769 RepID=A0A2T6B5U2_9RHOB|nr:FHA domain-containing protein [Allosediminivita pacifica]PTX51427.1 FHA domain-containing protein [Allosediminivita pacifica]GGA99745.1 hypothetical protein GCM10011324_07480 [Allosediminivita pacifica]